MTDSKEVKQAANILYQSVKCTHIDNIKQPIQDVVKNPTKFIKTTDSHVNKNIPLILNTTDIHELEYIIKIYFPKCSSSLKKDLDHLNTSQKIVQKKNKKVNKKKQGLTGDEIKLQNLQKQFKQNKFIFYVSKLLLEFNKKSESVCDLIHLCHELNKYNLKNIISDLLKTFCISDKSDIDDILSNLHRWKQQHQNKNFELTKCQQSILTFILNYCNSPHTSASTLLEMSNTGSGKTVGLIIAMGVLWKKLLYQQCVSHSFTTRGNRTHSVKFPTKIIIAILPSSVIQFTNTLCNCMHIPFGYVKNSTSTVILDEYNPNAVMNYSNMSRKVFTHFCEAGSTAPAIYITTEANSPNLAIFNCVKSAYNTVFKHINKYIDPNFIKSDQYLSYDIHTDSLSLGKTGGMYCPFNPDTIACIIGDDMETINCLSTIDIVPTNVLKIITTATPTGLSKKESKPVQLPKNTYIPSPQDEVRNTGGVNLIGSSNHINVVNIGMDVLFSESNTSPLDYKYRILFDSFIHGILERKYIIPQLISICSYLPSDIKNNILNRHTFFSQIIQLNIDSIAIHIMKQFTSILASDQCPILIDILENFPKHDNNLFQLDNLHNQLCTTPNRGIILCSPNFKDGSIDDCELVKKLTGDNQLVSDELDKFNELYKKYRIQIDKIQQQFNKSSCVDDSSKSDMSRMSSECVSDIPIPKFPLRHQLFSNEYLQQHNYQNSIQLSSKIQIEINQILEAIETDDTKLAQGVLSIDPSNSNKLDKSLQKYTTGSHNNFRCIQLKTDAFNTRQLLLGANPPSKLNIVVANYELIHSENNITINDGITKCTYPKESVINLLIQICGRVGRGIDAEFYNSIFVTNDVANILISTTPKTMLLKLLSK